MATSTGFPVMQLAVNVTLAALNAVTTRGVLKLGMTYRVVSTVDCWINWEQPAVIGEGMYIPANKPTYICFGAADTQGTAVELNSIAAGAGLLNLVPMMRVVTF